LARFTKLLMSVSDADLSADVTLAGRLMLDRADKLVISYAPFEHIQLGARLVIVGITPGAQQAHNALREARRKLLEGAAEPDVLSAAKVFASFSGPMRTNLVAMLDHIGVNKLLNLPTVANVWSSHTSLAHFTSALRYPVFVNGKNYSGSPSITGTPILQRLLNDCLAEEAKALPNSLWVPLGPTATEGVMSLVQQRILNPDLVIAGLPHPSGANAERIAYFLGRKERALLSKKTSASGIDAARDRLMVQIGRL
jgi:hypothetical protein